MNYGQLKQAVLDFSNKPELEQLVPTLVELATASLNRDVRSYRMDATVTLTVDQATESLPTGFLAVRAFRLLTSPVTPLVYVQPDAFDSMRDAARYPGKPYFYTLSGSQFMVSPSPDGSYQAAMTYRQALTVPTSDGATNWVLDSFPDAYLYGVLMHAAPLVNDARPWAAQYESAVAAINAQDDQTMNSPTYRGRKIGA